jgi:hypothetical protein
MNTQLSEGIKVWKAGEFERHVQRYLAEDHNPASPENCRKLSAELSGPTRAPRTTGISFNRFANAIGVRYADVAQIEFPKTLER